MPDGTGTTTTFTFVAKPRCTFGLRAMNFIGELGPPRPRMNGASFGFSRIICSMTAGESPRSVATHDAGTDSEIPCPGTEWRRKLSAAAVEAMAVAQTARAARERAIRRTV